MATTWKEVWAARRVESTSGDLLAQVMAADGLDTSFGKVAPEAWRRFVRETAGVMGICAGHSVFEVGCGAGAYLFDLYERGCEVAGLDWSPSLIGCARSIMTRAGFCSAEARELDPSKEYDFVVACGVFLYFPSVDYARDVLHRMVQKSRIGIMVLDVPDLAKRDESLAERRKLMGDEAYTRKYEGLDHLYFDKSWFAGALADFGIERIQIVDQSVEGYANSAYRYNVFAWR